MCLGRGGDQAAVKTENGFRFFGGVANGVEKNPELSRVSFLMRYRNWYITATMFI